MEGSDRRDTELLGVGRRKGALHKGAVGMENIEIAVFKKLFYLVVESRHRGRVLGDRELQRRSAEHLVAFIAVVKLRHRTGRYHAAIACLIHQFGIVMNRLHHAVDDRKVRIDELSGTYFFRIHE